MPPVHGIKPPSPLAFGSNVSENWKLFKQRWQTYTLIAELDKQTNPYQVAMLLHCLSDEALKVYNGFHFAGAEDARTVEDIMQKFEEFAVGQVNVTYERFVFYQRCQEEEESFERFYSAIRGLSKTCSFCGVGCTDSMIRDRLVLGIRDSNTRTELLKVRDLTLEKCVDVCRAAENATSQNKLLHPDTDTVHRVGLRRDMEQRREVKECKFCGTRHRFRKEECPAYGKTCLKCNGKNHFQRKCTAVGATASATTDSRDRRPRVHQVTVGDSSSDDAEWLNTVGSGERDLKCCMFVGGKEVTFQIDTGSSVNMLPARLATNIEPTNKVLKMWNHTQLSSLGKSTQKVWNPKNRKEYMLEFLVFKENFTPLLGLKASEQMNLINVCTQNFDRVAQLTAGKVEDNYSDVFDGSLGTLPGIQHLEVDPNVKPVVMANRRIPISVRPELKSELERLVEKGVIAPVDEPTPWVSQIVVAKKKQGGLRVCIDPPELNKALKREHYTLPVLEDVLHELGQSAVFSKADLSSGFWHVQLDEESSLLTTFQTCFGRYRWLRLPFGTSVSSEIFQRKLLEAFDGLAGVACVADDVIIHGQTLEDHDKHLDSFFGRCREKNVKLNKEKLVLRSDNITFMGHKINKEGLQTDPQKTEAIKDYPAPKNLEELRRFLGMVNYLARYLSHLTENIHPLQNLLKKNVPWTWSDSQERAFQTVKRMIVNSPVLAFYDPTKELTLVNDASDYGLGCVLTQEGRPVAFASRTLSSTERNYAQIEKEMLAAVHGLEKFHHYTYGRHVHVITDHKPLVSIVVKPLSKAPRRLQSMLLRTQAYDYTLSYRPGTQIPVADALSRAPTTTQPPDTEFENVNSLALSPFNPQRLSEIKQATASDDTLVQLMDTVVKGWPNEKSKLPVCITPYFDYRDELTVQDGIVLRGERVVIPTSMRKDLKDKVHAGHFGINSCLRRARDLIFWPRMSSEIRQYIESCDICASHGTKQAPEPLNMHEVPNRPWEKVGTDIFTIKGRNYLVTVDYFSQFFEVDFLPETTSEVVVTKLKYHFARHGIPDVVVSDNGPQYSSQHFKAFSRKWVFSHETSSPGNSKANGAAEAAVKVAKNMMKKCHDAKEDHYLGLLNLRNTPQEGLTTSPAQRLMGRRTKTIVPTTSSLLKPAAAEHIEGEKQRMENKRSKVAERYIDRKDLPPLQLGDAVRMQPIDNSRDWKEATVTQRLKSRTYEVTTRDGRNYRRNRVFLRSTRRTPTPGNDTASHLLGTPSLPVAQDTPHAYNYMHTASDGAADSSASPPASDASCRPDEPPAGPQTSPATPAPAAAASCGPMVASPIPSRTADKTWTEPYTTRFGRSVKQRNLLDL